MVVAAAFKERPGHESFEFKRVLPPMHNSKTFFIINLRVLHHTGRKLSRLSRQICRDFSSHTATIPRLPRTVLPLTAIPPGTNPCSPLDLGSRISVSAIPTPDQAVTSFAQEEAHHPNTYCIPFKQSHFYSLSFSPDSANYTSLHLST